MMNLQYMAVINDYQKVGYTQLKFYSPKDHVVLHYTKELCRVLSGVILLGERGKEKA